jgi:signal peptidase I
VEPHRHDVVVFKYPKNPQKNHVALNYIKRLWGLPGETIGIHNGKVYVSTAFSHDDAHTTPPEELRQPKFMHATGDSAIAAVEQLKQDVRRPMNDPERKFHIVRKTPDVVLALSRPVYDNDHQAHDLIKIGKPPRWWSAEKKWQAGDQSVAWKPDDPNAPRVFTLAPKPEIAWLRYRHLLRDHDEPQPIKDFIGYNTAEPSPRGSHTGLNTVGDLLLECEVKVTKAAKGDELWFELSKGPDRFQARIDLENGTCTLVRLTRSGPQLSEKTLAQKGTPLKGTGTFKVRFANVDERLTLWVNDQLAFGDGVAYDPPTQDGSDENNLQPASVGAKGAGITVSHLILRRDTYYTITTSGPGQLPDPNYLTMYVQPHHYLCLGDNSPESSDGREWGLVPDRLMLGRALMVYYPFGFWPAGSVSRVGPIR